MVSLKLDYLFWFWDFKYILVGLYVIILYLFCLGYFYGKCFFESNIWMDMRMVGRGNGVRMK